jgi:hypothetical protein
MELQIGSDAVVELNGWTYRVTGIVGPIEC